MKYAGLHTHRFKENPEEKRFAEAWSKQNEDGCNLAYSLDPHSGTHGRPVERSSWEHQVAATVMQWLGSPVGQFFLYELGYERADNLSSEFEAKLLKMGWKKPAK